MAWLAVDKDGEENLCSQYPTRYERKWSSASMELLPSGSIERLIGRKLTWEGEPVELTEATLAKPVEVTDKEMFFRKQVDNPYPVGQSHTAWERGFIRYHEWMLERMKR